MDIIEFSNIDNVYLMDNYDSTISVEGKIHVTVSHLIFRSNNHSREIWILMHLISTVDISNFSSMGKVLVIKCKDFHVYRFAIQDACCDKLKSVILKLIENIDEHYKLPCFVKNHDNDIPKSAGWKTPKQRLMESFERMGLPNSQWKFTDINKDHKISDTYPSVLVVPDFTSISIMKACSKFRSRGRLPVLTYFHKSKKAAMCRCSQPLVGFSARCLEDITMLKRIKDTASEEHREVLHVIDTRPRINALTNKAKGKGYESEIDYEKIAFQFFDIENIHVMRSSLEKLLKACRNTTQTHSQYTSAIEKSGWLKHIKVILDTSFSMAKKLDLGENVVVHCSDGWDRTSQVCGLAQVILDPHYRTFEGLEELIEKDWLAFGHKFSDRCGHLSGIDPTEVSPVFTQFLDCLYQMSNYFPDQFQYNERLLRHIHRWSQDCEYGTFVGNCEKDRIDLKIWDLSPSVWAYIKYNLWDYCNPYYNPDAIIPVLDNIVPTCDLSIWMSLYCPNEDITSINACSVSIPDNLFTLQKLTKSVDYHNAHMLTRAKHILDILTRQSISSEFSGNLDSIKARVREIELRLVPVQYDNIGYYSSYSETEQLSVGNVNWTIDQEISSVANDCSVLRLQKKCHDCQRQFVPLSRKNLCYSCGMFFCALCISERINLFGHGNAGELFPVCKACFEKWAATRQRVYDKSYSNSDITQCFGDKKIGNGEYLSVSNDPLLDMVVQQKQGSASALAQFFID